VDGRCAGARDPRRLVGEPRAHDPTLDLLHAEHVDVELSDRVLEPTVGGETSAGPAVTDVPGRDADHETSRRAYTTAPSTKATGR
jgi:hypothetical protein